MWGVRLRFPRRVPTAPRPWGTPMAPPTMDFFQDLDRPTCNGGSPLAPALRSHALSPQGRHGGLSGRRGMFSRRNQLDSGEFEVGVMHLPQGPTPRCRRRSSTAPEGDLPKRRTCRAAIESMTLLRPPDLHAHGGFGDAPCRFGGPHGPDLRALGYSISTNYSRGIRYAGRFPDANPGPRSCRASA